jgi:hypothetical protein
MLSRKYYLNNIALCICTYKVQIIDIKFIEYFNLPYRDTAKEMLL